ncbi:MAG: ATP-binding protein [Myxococcota bacterium]
MQDLSPTMVKRSAEVLGRIQPHGVLLVLTPEDRIIRMVSINSAMVLGIAPSVLLGQPLDVLLGEAGARAALRDVSDNLDESSILVVRRLMIDGQVWVGTLHRTGPCVVLEIEERFPSQDEEMMLVTLRPMLDRLTREPNLERLLTRTAAEVRRLTGADRVMISRNEPPWSGEVVAESLGGRLDSIVGTPLEMVNRESDAALSLYRYTMFNLVDVDAPSVPLRAQGAWDVSLSDATLRTFSRSKTAQLRRMGVQGKASLSLIVDGARWGRLVCHHAQPLRLPFSVRVMCENVAQVVSFAVSSILKARREQQRSDAREKQTRLLQKLDIYKDARQGLVQASGLLMGMVGATGAALMMDGDVVLMGQTPSRHEAHRLWRSFALSESELMTHTDVVVEVHPEMSAFVDLVAGALGIWISPEMGLMWFRTEWNPGQQRSAPWTVADRDIALEVRGLLLQRLVKSSRQREVRLERQAKHRLAELQVLTEELSQSNAELERFAYIASHDLREPLRAVIGFAELLQLDYADRLDDDAREYIEHIVTGSMRMRDMIHGLLEISRVTSKALVMERVSLDDVVSGIVEDLAPRIQETGAHMTVNPLPAVMGDRAGLYSLMLNLIGNAVKFRMPGRTAIVLVSGRTLEDEWEISVTDNGIGIARRHLQVIFQIFRRLNLREEYEGLGIGLSLCKRIVDRHKGSMVVSSTEGLGTTFTVRLPKRAPGAALSATSPPSE